MNEENYILNCIENYLLANAKPIECPAEIRNDSILGFIDEEKIEIKKIVRPLYLDDAGLCLADFNISEKQRDKSSEYRTKLIYGYSGDKIFRAERFIEGSQLDFRLKEGPLESQLNHSKEWEIYTPSQFETLKKIVSLAKINILEDQE